MPNQVIPTEKLINLCSKIGSGATPRGGSSVYLDEGEISLIRSQNVLNNEFSDSGLVYINSEAAEKLSNVVVEKDDVLLNITGDSVARCCQVDSKVLPARVNQHVAIIRPKTDRLDPRYLRYFLVSAPMQNYMLGLAGAGATRNALTKGMIEGFDIPCPDMGTQQNIAHILGTLDDKIELNRQMNQTLEAMAQALFKSWFVDFDPVIDNALAVGNEIPETLQKSAAVREALGDQRKSLPTDIQSLFPDRFVFTEEMGWVPEGWEVTELKKFGEIICGKTPSKSNPDYFGGEVPFIKIPDMHSAMFVISPSEYLSELGASSQAKKEVPRGSVCVSCIATVGKVVITTEPSHTNQQINTIVPRDSWTTNYLYFSMLDMNKVFHDLASGGSATLNMNTSTFYNVKILRPSEQNLKTFSDETADLVSKIEVNMREVQTLSKLRNILLPKLLSGELRISDAEKQVAEAV